MKKNHTKVIIIVLFFSLLIISVFSYFNFSKNSHRLNQKTNLNSTIIDKLEPKIETKIQPTIKSSVNHLTDNKSASIVVSLMVLDKTYNIEAPVNSSVFDLMKILEEKNSKENAFNFKYTEYLGLGAFITEINGVEGSPGKYWIYYINNKEASIGVSKYVLQNGDIISWKQGSF